MNQKFKFGAIVVSMVGVVCLAGASFADDDQPQRKKRIQVVVKAAPGGKYWLGVHAVPVDDALKSHLGIGDRLIIQQVVPESPAAKAGLQQHDILLKFGDSDLSELADLMAAIVENKDQQATVTLLRGGKEQTIQVTPGERSEQDIALALPAGDARDIRGLLGEWLGDLEDDDAVFPRALRFGIIGPGIVAGEDHDVHVFATPGKLPENLSISITKTGDEPAKIIVKQADKTWEVTEENLEELPEEIRAHVERMVGKGARTFSFQFAPEGKGIRLRSFSQLDENDDDADDDGPRVQRRVLQLRRSQDIEGRRPAIRSARPGASDVEKLQQDVEQLRKEIEKLKGDRNRDDAPPE